MKKKGVEDMKKKWMSVCMVLSMLMTLVPTAVYAEETTASEDAEWKAELLEEWEELQQDELMLMGEDLSLFAYGDHKYREVEPNNRPGYADIVQNDFTVQASLTTEDLLDYFVFELKEESHVNITSIAEGEESLVFFISDKDDQVLHISNAVSPSGNLYGDVMAVTLSAGKYYISFMDFKTPVCESLDYTFYIEIAAAKEAYRVYGTSRCDTAIKAADVLQENMGIDAFETVVVANAENFADALAGSYLAAKTEAPILLTNLRSEAEVQAYINENLKNGGTVYILGGPLAVAESFEAGLDNSFAVERLYGTSRYDTNLAILREAGVGGSDEILVCTGTNFADSLSVSSAGKPILLTGNSLTAAQKEFLEETSGEFIIIGGPLAVSDAVEAQLEEIGMTERLYGTSRFDTSVAVAEYFFDAPETMVLAYAQNFPDGLSGGPLAYQLDAPLVLTQNGKQAAAANYAKENGIDRGYVMAGPC